MRFSRWIAWTAYAQAPLMQAALVLLIAAGVYALHRWHRLASAADASMDSGVLDTLRFHRRQLERHRDARAGNWRWWLPPFLPGLILIFVSLVVEFGPVSWPGFSIAWYQRSARRMQKEIDALDSMAVTKQGRGQQFTSAPLE